MKKGDMVKVYDGDLIGFTTATLVERMCKVESGDNERWLLLTKEGYNLIRIVRSSGDALKDGCGYLISKDPK